DEEAVLRAADEVVLRRLGVAVHDEVTRHGPVRVGLREAVTRRLPPLRALLLGLERRAAVPDDVAGDALVDERDRPGRDALEVEGHARGARVRHVVPDRELVREELLPELPRAVAPPLEPALRAA